GIQLSSVLLSFPTRRSSDLIHVGRRRWKIKRSGALACRAIDIERDTVDDRVSQRLQCITTGNDAEHVIAVKSSAGGNTVAIKGEDRKSTCLNSSHLGISYAV